MLITRLCCLCFSYPTFRYFYYGKKDFKYTGGREAKDFIQFMEDPREGPPLPPPELEWKDIPSHVHHLTDDTFDAFVKRHDSVLVMFYAPCKCISLFDCVCCLPAHSYLKIANFFSVSHSC